MKLQACIALLFVTTFIRPGMANANSVVSESVIKESKEERAMQMYLEAKKLIVDGFPEDRDRAQNLLIDSIRLAPHKVEPFAELARYTLWQIANSVLEPTAIYQASELATHVKDIAPERPLGDYLNCEILLAAGQYQQALKLYADVKSKFPNHIDTDVFEARFWSDIEPRRALEAAQRALAKKYPMDDLSPAIAEALVKASEAGDAGDNIVRFATIYPDRWLWHRAGLAYIDEKNYTAARGAFLKAIDLGNVLESQLQLGILEDDDLHMPEEAVRHLADLKKTLVKKRTIQGDSLAMVSAHLSAALIDSGKVTEAIQQAEEALKYAESGTVINSVVSEFSKRERDVDLIPALERIAKKNPTQDFVFITLGNLASKRRDFSEAVSEFSKALLISPERDDVFSARGHARYSMHNYAAALQDFETAVRLRPDSGSHRYNRACMLARLGRKTEAMEDLKEALNLDGDLKELARRDEDLAALRQDKIFVSELFALGVLGNDDTLQK